jgi:hypothetical protein
LKKLLQTAVFSFLLLLPLVYPQGIKSPEEFLGFKVGADYKLADYETITAYFKHLSENSGKIHFEIIGKTSLGKDMFMAILSSEENIINLEKYRDIVKQLSDPRRLTEDQARLLSEDGKVVLLVTCNIHSTEIASAQMSMEFAYNLASGNAPGKSLNALKDVILILMPSINPDGTTMIVDWYNKYLGTEFEGSPLPYLYHKYSGHDNNRDWFMFNLAETKNVINIAFHKWMPQIWLDEHQMGSTGARLFVVPYKDPINPNVHPLIWQWQKVIGSLTTLRLEQEGKTGVIDHAYFEGWWEGPASDCGLWHNQIALLSEMASCNIASPVYIDPYEVKATPGLTTYDIRTNYPHPWRGGWWRLRDIVDYELSLTYSLLETSAQYKEELLYNYYEMGKDAVEQGRRGNPFALVIPREQNDPVTVSKMIEILQDGGVEVHFMDKEFRVASTLYPADSYVIYTAQPNGKYVKDLFEEQQYPDLRNSKKEDPITPYDVAGWTLPYLMGVKYSTINDPFEIQPVLLNDPNYKGVKIDEQQGKYYIIKSGANVNSTFINRLQKAKVPVYWNTEKLLLDGNQFNEGSVIFPQNKLSGEELNKLAGDLHLQIYSCTDIDSKKLKELKKVKVGLYHSYSANMDEGWTRLLLENYEFDFVQIYNKDFKEKDLKDKLDVIIIPDMDPEVIKTGKYGGEYKRYNRPKPKEFEGGIEKEGIENLKKFIEKDGGRLITFGNACNFAIEDLELRIRNSIKELKSNEFYCPGSLISLNVDNTNPIGYGLEKEIIGYQGSTIAFETSIPFGSYDRSIIVRYPDKNILKSGYLLGEDNLYRKAALVDLKHNSGHVILIGFKVQNRHQTFGTFKLLFNSIHAAGIL